MPRKAKTSFQYPKFFRHRRQFPKENFYDDTSPSQLSSNRSEGEQQLHMKNDDPSYVDSGSSVSSINARGYSRCNKSALRFHPNSRADTTYIDVAPLPIFRGKSNECPVTHLSRFAKVCRANNAWSIEMMMRIFPVTLEDEAALWYDLNIEPYSPSLTWEEIKSSFLEAFNRIDMVDQLRAELIMISQGREEPVRSYFLRMQWILKRLAEENRVSDSLIKGIFLDGLREDLRDWVIQRRPSSVKEALRIAFNFEHVKGMRDIQEKLVECGLCEVRERRICELWGKCEEMKKDHTLGSLGSNETEEGIESSISNKEGSVVRPTRNDYGREVRGTLSWKESKKKNMSQCQCSKHQCWRKSSRLTTKSDAE